MIKTLFVNGCSWTEGHMLHLDPEVHKLSREQKSILIYNSNIINNKNSKIKIINFLSNQNLKMSQLNQYKSQKKLQNIKDEKKNLFQQQ